MRTIIRKHVQFSSNYLPSAGAHTPFYAGSSNAIVAARNCIDGNNGAGGKQRELGHVTVDRYQLFSNYEFRRHIVQLIYSRRRVLGAIYSRCTVASILHATAPFFSSPCAPKIATATNKRDKLRFYTFIFIFFSNYMLVNE